MGQMIDAVDPAHIGAAFNGRLAVKITVLSDVRGQVFDMESGNADPAADARAIRSRLDQGRWSIVYWPWSWQTRGLAALGVEHLALVDASRFPTPGVYLWASDPSHNIAAGNWRPPVTPVAVQDTFAGTFDLSTTAPTFPAQVAGYLDGPRSAWPSAAWARFVALPDTPAPTPGPTPKGEPVFVTHTPTGQYLVFDNGTKVELSEPADGSALTDPASRVTLGLPYVPLSDGTVGRIPDAH